MTRIIRPCHAYESETVRIAWTLADGTIYHQDVSIPPADTRRARVMPAAHDRPHSAACAAYGNDRPPYAACTCGADDPPKWDLLP